MLQFSSMFIDWISACITTPRFSILVNGGLVGYFRRCKGVRQGDPLSPYIFVLTMNVLSRLLDAAISHKVFMYHPKCKKVSLTHLCFADDLLIFSKGNISSIEGIQNILKTFYQFSRLQLNCSKNEIFSTGINSDKLLEIQQMIGFKLGALPVRYLGVPLVTRRLTEKDCLLLIENIKARISHWATRFLSYAGRLQLIQAVIYSIQNFWCKQILFPKRVLKKLNQLCCNFFWEGNRNAGRRAKVRWQDVCLPKAEGGLGLKDILSWNRACMIQHIWQIFAQAGTIWIAWIYAYILKERNIW